MKIIKSQKNTGKTKRQNYVQRNKESINSAMLFLYVKPQTLDQWNKVLINVAHNGEVEISTFSNVRRFYFLDFLGIFKAFLAFLGYACILSNLMFQIRVLLWYSIN